MPIRACLRACAGGTYLCACSISAHCAAGARYCRRRFVEHADILRLEDICDDLGCILAETDLFRLEQGTKGSAGCFSSPCSRPETARRLPTPQRPCRRLRHPRALAAP